MKLGKHPAKHDNRTLLLANYLQPEKLPKLPESYGYSIPDSGMLGNDTVGDCVIAGALHYIEYAAKSQGNDIAFTTDQAIKVYSDFTGYIPGDETTDNGANELDFLKWWKANGLLGHKLYAYLALEPGNLDHIRYAIMLSGACYNGLALPNSAMTQRCWCIPPQGLTGDGAPGSAGGHATLYTRYSPGWFNDCTWGAEKLTTPGFITSYNDETYLLLIEDLFDSKNMAANGLALNQINADLKLL